MDAFTVTAPAAGFTGESVGVTFTDGTATVPADNTAALRYFRAQGYGVEPISEPEPSEAEAEAEPEADIEPEVTPEPDPAPTESESDESPAEQPKPARGRKSTGEKP